MYKFTYLLTYLLDRVFVTVCSFSRSILLLVAFFSCLIYGIFMLPTSIGRHYKTRRAVRPSVCHMPVAAAIGCTLYAHGEEFL